MHLELSRRKSSHGDLGSRPRQLPFRFEHFGSYINGGASFKHSAREAYWTDTWAAFSSDRFVLLYVIIPMRAECAFMLHNVKCLEGQ